MSFKTPIFTTPPDISACAAPPASAQRAAAANSVFFISQPPCSPLFEGSSDAQILLDLGSVGRQIAVVELVDHPPVLHHVMAVGHRRGEAEILLDEQDREAFDLEPFDRAPDL